MIDPFPGCHDYQDYSTISHRFNIFFSSTGFFFTRLSEFYLGAKLLYRLQYLSVCLLRFYYYCLARRIPHSPSFAFAQPQRAFHLYTVFSYTFAVAQKGSKIIVIECLLWKPAVRKITAFSYSCVSYLYIYLSLYLSILISIYPSIYLSIYLSFSLFLCICLYIYLHIYLSLGLPAFFTGFFYVFLLYKPWKRWYLLKLSHMNMNKLTNIFFCLLYASMYCI